VPPAGNALDKSKTVLIHTSSGADQIEAPKVVGLTLSSAKAQLEKAGLKVGTLRWVYADEAGYMAVLSQVPAAGEKIKPGSEITLAVNRD
jgi:serine/threonine-protein kinase